MNLVIALKTLKELVDDHLPKEAKEMEKNVNSLFVNGLPSWVWQVPIVLEMTGLCICFRDVKEMKSHHLLSH